MRFTPTCSMLPFPLFIFDFVKKRLVRFWWYAGAPVASLLVVTWVMRLWQADFSVPFAFGRDDALQVSMIIKGLSEGGWGLWYPRLGAPGELALYDFPLLRIPHFLIIQLLLFMSTDYATALNPYFLLTFPLTVITTMVVLRSFAVSHLLAAISGLLFAFLPYHFLRGESHLWLATYYTIPLDVMLVLWIFQRRKFTFRRRTADQSAWRRSMYGLAICVVTGLGSPYYAFFVSVFLLIAASVAFARYRTPQTCLAPCVFFVVLAGTVVINTTPTLWYISQHGKNPLATRRVSAEAEMYGLKIIQLLLPVSGHRIARLAALREWYDHSAPLVNENQYATLGIIGSAGFLFLLGRISGTGRRTPGRISSIT
jgi:phosphoglycerol transferase